MKLLNLIIASTLGFSSLTFAQQQSNALKDFVTTKTAEIIADETKILALKESINKLQENQELAKSLNLEENSKFLLAGGGFTAGGSLLFTMVDFVTGAQGSNLSNDIRKLTKVGFKIGGVLLATGAVVYFGNQIYFNLTNTEIEQMKRNIARVERDNAVRREALTRISQNIDLK